MFMKLGRYEVLMALHMHEDILVISTQGWIQGEAKIGQGVGPHQKNSSDWKAQ